MTKEVDQPKDEDDDDLSELSNFDDINDASNDWESVSEFNKYTEKVEQSKIKAKLKKQ